MAARGGSAQRGVSGFHQCMCRSHHCTDNQTAALECEPRVGSQKQVGLTRLYGFCHISPHPSKSSCFQFPFLGILSLSRSLGPRWWLPQGLR